MTTRYKELTPQHARDMSAAVWAAYQAREWLARGLPSGSSLDMRAGRIVEPPITVRYVRPVVLRDESAAALPVDDFVLSRHGRDGVDVSGAVEAEALPTRLRLAVSGEEETAPPPPPRERA